MTGREGLARLVLAAAIVAGVSYLAADRMDIAAGVHTAWKGAGVGLLAVYAALKADRLDGWLITAVMALGALGDVLLETNGMVVGALAFLSGHAVAIWLYLRNRRASLSRSQALFAIVLVPAVVGIAYLLPTDRAMAPVVAVYATGLAVMAASAWISRFPRYWTGLGAIAFVVSDLLIFARAGPLEGAPWIGFAVWALYFLGQAMIAVGVTRQLASQVE
jgi:uncharacterized membrane protein YhhN